MRRVIKKIALIFILVWSGHVLNAQTAVPKTNGMEILDAYINKIQTVMDQKDTLEKQKKLVEDSIRQKYAELLSVELSQLENSSKKQFIESKSEFEARMNKNKAAIMEEKSKQEQAEIEIELLKVNGKINLVQKKLENLLEEVNKETFYQQCELSLLNFDSEIVPKGWNFTAVSKELDFEKKGRLTLMNKLDPEKEAIGLEQLRLNGYLCARFIFTVEVNTEVKDVSKKINILKLEVINSNTNALISEFKIEGKDIPKKEMKNEDINAINTKHKDQEKIYQEIYVDKNDLEWWGLGLTISGFAFFASSIPLFICDEPVGGVIFAGAGVPQLLVGITFLCIADYGHYERVLVKNSVEVSMALGVSGIGLKVSL